MIFEPAIALAAAILASPQDSPVRAEASCISDELFAQADAKKKFDPDSAAQLCRSRYNWTPEETDLAVAAAKALSIALDDRQKAIAAGVPPALLDEAFASLKDGEIAPLGWPGKSTDVYQLVAENNARILVAGRLGRIDDLDASLKAQVAVISRARLRNANRAFLALRANRK